MKGIIVQLIYILAAAFFIFGLKMLSKVRTARRGNALASLGMLVAIVLTVIEVTGARDDITGHAIALDYIWVLAAMVIGGGIGLFSARFVQMTAMPQMVAIFNGFGGAASTLVALSFVFRGVGVGHTGETLFAFMGGDTAVTTLLSIIIGSVTFSGSIIAFAKLQELMTGQPILFKGQNAFNLFFALLTLAVAVWMGFFVADGGSIEIAALVLTGITLVLGVLLVIPIGGADMPVVISLLNSYSGLAACAAGFVVKNNLLIISGSLVGASGLILTNIMCVAMNRSLANVLFGGFGAESTTGAGGGGEYKNVKDYSAEDAAMVLETAEKVIFVPGYGLAVAQAQHACKELGELLESRGCEVLYAVHPVAGRMPGHMNVLLAEADVSYDKLIEMDDINPQFKQTDVAIVLGANDVVNPAALNDPTSPIYGMPILNVHEARTVFVVKRSLGAGFAGIKNTLFENDNTLMVFGDAKKVLNSLITEVRALGK